MKAKYLLLLLSIFIFQGCAPKVVSYGSIDKNDKSITIQGIGYFFGTLRQEFRKNGWIVLTEAGDLKTQGIDNQGKVDLNTAIQYKTRYTLSCKYREYSQMRFEPDFGFNCTIFDNKESIDLANFSSTGEPEGAMEVKKIAKLIIDWTDKN